MLTSIAANHAKGKSAEDTIFAANAACVAAAKKNRRRKRNQRHNRRYFGRGRKNLYACPR